MGVQGYYQEIHHSETKCDAQLINLIYEKQSLHQEKNITWVKINKAHKRAPNYIKQLC